MGDLKTFFKVPPVLETKFLDFWMKILIVFLDTESFESYFFDDPSLYDDYKKQDFDQSTEISSSQTTNTFDGTNSNDTIDKSSETASVIINGLDGNDTLEGGINNDTINGGDGVDKLVGNQGDDVLRGDDGNDFIFGGDGKDKLIGDWVMMNSTVVTKMI